MQKQQANIKVKQQFPLTIKRLGINGEGVGYFKRTVVFVPGALPGEEVVVEAKRVHPKFVEGIVKKVRKRSPHRIKAPCPVYEQCGGCQLQHLAYDQQLIEKRDIIIQALERHTKINVEELDIRATIGMENPWLYRNKSQFQLGEDHGKIISGLYSMDSHRLINVPECIVQHPLTNKITQVVTQILNDFHVPVYNEKTGKGIVRTIVTRVGIQTGQAQVVLITAQKELPRKDIILSEIKQRLPEVVSVAQNINAKKTSIIFGNETIHLSGKEIIEERLEEFTYELSARAFFQLNPIQTVKLYNEVKKAAGLTGVEKIADAYCGVGTIGLWLADGASEIRGMDIIPEAIEDAKKNAAAHHIPNAHYYAGKAEVLLPKWLKEGWHPDVVVVDPPRFGCDEALLRTILKVKPKKFVYVSCNPSTLAKDLQVLSKAYDIEYMQPVDIFPQTVHVECVAWMSRVV
ncbi:23S rRNA (uracil(1939)-C(5))-methyltransferase RlmD [Heyndrickxia acidiproducens]|uniref:23S rRNA (uracil(1939)-C(5))-methyltransferase RlmD n=1 Tax=Heyndrickxia acidiproducens TaxID=1121084 RepID=UPI000375338A|nr:23S rRNA (uracil(1939)-C(5))-methyltransferase RlmD [Heyndrickxia acidiproducens]